jgi:hypothetical protein
MTSRLLIFLISAFLSSCVTVRPITGPDGSANELIRCPAVEHCYKKAIEICHGPYKIVNTSSDISGINGSTDTTINMLIKCDPTGNPASSMPSLTLLRAQNRCTPAADKANAFDCMVDQPDGSLKRIRFFEVHDKKP